MSEKVASVNCEGEKVCGELHFAEEEEWWNSSQRIFGGLWTVPVLLRREAYLKCNQKTR
jgi:hypothetical protein